MFKINLFALVNTIEIMYIKKYNYFVNILQIGDCMDKFIFVINKITSILLIFFIVLLALSQYSIIQISDTLKSVCYFLSLVLIILSSTRELFTTNSGFSKFISITILLSLLIGGVFAIINSGLNILLYLCILFSLIFGLVDLVYKKA